MNGRKLTGYDAEACRLAGGKWQDESVQCGSKGCFIATAAMESPVHPYVQSLRDFRDNVLLKSKYSQTFENMLEKYYRLSPPIAQAMKRSRALKVFLRYSVVYPIVFSLKLIVPFLDILLGIRRDAERRGRQKSSR